MHRPPLPSNVVPAGNLANSAIIHAGAALNPPGARPVGPPSDPAVDIVLSAILDIKNNIFGLLQYIETQTEFLSWPLVMDRFSLISSQLSNLGKTMKSDRFPDFRKTALVPYFVSQDTDPAVERLTEGRITAVNHENVPSYLRTKLDPEVENRFEQAISKVPLLPPEAAQKADKQVQHLNKVVTALIEQLETARNEWDSKGAGQVSDVSTSSSPIAMHPIFSQVLQFSDLSTAGDLFAIPDADIIKDLPQIFPRLEQLVSSAAYLCSHYDQSVVEICVTRITAAIRETGSLSLFVVPLLSLLRLCLSNDLSRTAAGDDPPHAKIASDIINCVFLCYSLRNVMELAIPIGMKFLTGENTELSRNMSCYLSLIAIQQPFLVMPYVGEIVRAVLTGNSQLIRILPQLYSVNPKPVLGNIQFLVKMMPICDEADKDSLLNLTNLVARDYPQTLWLVVGDLANMLGESAFTDSLLRIFSHIASNSGAPFLTHMTKIKKAVDSSPNLLSVAARIFGAVGKAGEAVAIDCLGFLISRSVKLDYSLVPYVIAEIRIILEAFPLLLAEVNSLVSLHLMTGNDNIVAIANHIGSPNASLDPIAGYPHYKHVYSMASQPPPYGATDYPPYLPRTARNSPYNSRLHGLGKTAVDVRQISTASSKSIPCFYGSTNNMPINQSSSVDFQHSKESPEVAVRSDVLQYVFSPGRYRREFSWTHPQVNLEVTPAQYGFRPREESSINRKGMYTSEVSSKNLEGSRGSIVANLTSRTSHQSLASKGNSRHSLASSGIISTINQKGSKHSLPVGNRLGFAAAGKSSNLSTTELKSNHIPCLSPVHSRTDDHGSGVDSPQPVSFEQPLHTFVVENAQLSKSSEAINIRSRRNSRHSLAPRPRSRIVETSNQPQIIQVVPIHDAVYQFCERNLDKIRRYMACVLVRFPLPARCAIEQQKSRKYCKLHFTCQCKGDQCLYASRYFTFHTCIPRVWIHLMFLAIQAKAVAALNQQDSAVHALKLCWDRLENSKDFSTLVTSAFPTAKDQEDLLKELSSSRYFDVFQYNASIKQWGCFLCNYPEKASVLFSEGAPLMEGILKEKKGRWTFLRRWKSRYFTLAGPYLTYKSSTEKTVPIDMRRIRSVKAVNGRGIRSIPTVFEIFTSENKVYLLKADDPKNAEQWLQCLQIAMAQSQSAEEYGHII